MRRRLTVAERRDMYRNRCRVAAGLMGIAATVLVGRAVQMQLVDQAFLNNQADARQLRTTELSAHRGTITDRNGEPLAVSTPVDSVWVEPKELVSAPEEIPVLAQMLKLDQQELSDKLSRNANKEFLYLKRHMNPSAAQRVMDAGIPGVHLQREYRRYYPAGEVAGHLVGFANVDDEGQEGLELAFEHRLQGVSGKKRVIKNRRGQIVEEIELIKAPEPGQDIATSIDLRIQYLAYRELKKAVQTHKAKSGSAVVVDVTTGEVLAMVNQPSYNPNDRSQFKPARYRNRAITDIFEPGSSIKPLMAAAALESGDYTAGSVINTNPGFIKVASKVIKDKENLGRINIGTMLARSSNVGASMLSMSLEPEDLWGVLDGFGLGRPTASGFPGESAGLLSHYSNWRPISQATLAYGYGVSITALQLAQAYAVLGAEGLQRPVSLVRTQQPAIPRRVISAESANLTMNLMQQVVADGGTGTKAAVTGYQVAGKTGTTVKATSGGYADDIYTAIFAGVAPISNPRRAVVVVVDEPRGKQYYGGQVAAPVFSRIVADATRILAIPPDDLNSRTDNTATVAQR